MIRHLWILICWVLSGTYCLYSQSLSVFYQLGDTYKIIEKHNYRKWENGKYLGAVYREIRGMLKRDVNPEEARFRGRFYLLEQTQQGGTITAPLIEASFPAEILVTGYGIILSSSVERFPTMRKFPILPGEGGGGNRWQEMAERVLDPDFNGKVTVVPVLVDYRYEGVGTYRNEEGHRVAGKYAVRYRGESIGTKDPDLKEVQGTHDVVIFLSKREGGMRFITETFKEEYRYKTGRIIRLEGTVATFFEGVTPLSPTRIAEVLGIPRLPDTASIPQISPARPASPSASPDVSSAPLTGSALPPDPSSNLFPQPSSAPPPVSAPLEAPKVDLPAEPKLSHAFSESPLSPRILPDVELEEKPEGLTLTVKNLRFKPDSAELLPEENSRLLALANGLKQIPNKRFLVVGHTADVGNPVGQKKLSLERAKTIVEALVRLGVPKDRFLYEGRGGKEPVAPNSDETGRARNRRVEITILEE